MFKAITQHIKLAREIGASVLEVANTVAAVLDPRLSSHLEEGRASTASE